MSPTIPTNLRKVIIEGLQKVLDVEQDGWTVALNDSSGLYTLSMSLREDELVWNGLWQRIEDCGFGMPRSLVHGQVEYQKYIPLYAVREHDEVLVVADDQASTPTTIKISETLISHANTHHVPPLEFHSLPTSEREVRDNREFRVSFERTTRIPDDNKLHHLPASLGRYQLFSVDAYSKHLPKNVTDAGGVFFSMWQREAMWLNFQQGSQKYAVRVFVGRVNAITGQEMQKESDQPDGDRTQDYIVIPGQQWLDGICVAPGIVRQFVAMPLGSGYTVEGQKTSEEKHGGLQLEVTPEMVRGKRFWSHNTQRFITHPGDVCLKPDRLDESKTPHELGCKVGDILKSYPTEPTYRKPFQLQDLVISMAEGMGENNSPPNNDSLLAPPITLKASGGTWPRVLIEHTKGSSTRTKGSIFQAFGGKKCSEDVVHDEAPSVSVSNIPTHHSSIVFGGALSSSYAPAEALAYAPKSISSDYDDNQTSTYDFDTAPEGITLGLDKCHIEAGGGPVIMSDQLHDNTGGKEKTDLMELTELQKKNIKTLGLAAGGKLIQDIYKDPYPATTWNHAAARILHVHMIDPESCEKVTHVVPQPPPVAVEDYVKSGGQFYVVEEKVDERLDGGDFDNVKSVSQMDEQVGVTTEPGFDPTKPKMCTTCERRLCDCIIRPCNHQFCNICIKRLEQSGDTEPSAQQLNRWKCPTCNSPVSHVAGFSAPMNLPGEERLLRTKVPVNVLQVQDGRMRFSSVQMSKV